MTTLRKEYDVIAIDTTAFPHLLIYNDAPRPSFWRHPVQWWRWKPQLIAWCGVDFAAANSLAPDRGYITVDFIEDEEHDA